MKKLIKSILVLLILAQAAFAQDVTTVEAKDSDISDNLDLEAVASLFGECENIEDFEKRLNDPETQISNLDLNEDGEVDYLRVVENSKDGTYLITLQAVLGDDLYQDVATIDVEKDSEGETQVQVVGDVYMYGPDYIIEPVYVHPPVIFVYFWSPYYNPWYSPYYWGYYPPYYRPRPPFPPHVYRSNVRVHISINNTYRHTTVRRSHTSVTIHNSTRRNDYGKKNPNKSFNTRNAGVNNRQDLNRQRGTTNTRNSNTTNTRNVKSNNTKQSTGTRQSTGKPVQSDWKPSSNQNKGNTQVKSTRGNVSSGNANTNTKQSRPANSNSSNNKSTRPSNNQQSNNKSTNTRESKNQRSNNNVSSNKTNTRQSGTQKSNSKESNRSERKSKKR